MAIIPALWRHRQEDLDNLEASLFHMSSGLHSETLSRKLIEKHKLKLPKVRKDGTEKQEGNYRAVISVRRIP